MSEKIVQLNEEVIKGQLKEMVRGSVEETLNELLEQEAEKLSNQQGDQQGRLQKHAGAYQVEPHHRQENPYLAGILRRCN